MASPDPSDPPPEVGQLDSIKAAVARLHALIETSDLEDEEKRDALLTRLNQLDREITAPTGENIPDSLHEALRRTEGLAVSRLLSPGSKEAESASSGGLDLHWKDELEAIETALQSWEARHPRLCSAFLSFTDILSKLGV